MAVWMAKGQSARYAEFVAKHHRPSPGHLYLVQMGYITSTLTGLIWDRKLSVLQRNSETVSRDLAWPFITRSQLAEQNGRYRPNRLHFPSLEPTLTGSECVRPIH